MWGLRGGAADGVGAASAAIECLGLFVLVECCRLLV